MNFDFLGGRVDPEVMGNLVASVLAILALFVFRFLSLRFLIRENMPVDEQRRIVVNSRNAILLGVVFALVFVWAKELQTLALSFLAVAAAIVLATKEIILCLSGGFYRASSGSFKVGDRIEAGNFRGDVIDLSLLATTILEIGPGQTSHQQTGRTIVLPNSLFLTTPVINETFTEDYVLHLFTVPLKMEEDWQKAEALILDAAMRECKSYLETARPHFEKIQKRHAMEVTQIDPRVSVLLPEPGRVNLLVRIPAPSRRKGRIEQAILRRFMGQWKQHLEQVKEQPSQ